jgi:ribonuclease BN (tRNA processing enzyme)
MEITVLGSNGTHPTAGRAASGYLVTAGTTNIWMDAGFGTFMALCSEIEPVELDAIFLSHVHPDHCVDLLAYYHYARFGAKQRVGMPVYIPEGLDEVLANLAFHSEDAFRSTCDFRVVGPGDVVAIGGIGLQFARTNHPVPTNAVRMEAEGRSFLYTADTGVSEPVANLAVGVDVLLSEAAFQGPGETKEYDKHLTASEAGQMASAAEVGRLVLTHINPALDVDRSVAEAEAHFEGMVSVAVPGNRIKI